MVLFHIPPLLLVTLYFLLQPLSTIANIYNINTLLKSNLVEQFNQTLFDETLPTRFFEVTKPIKLPNTEPCTLQVLQHKFGRPFRKPPVTAHYNPPTDCPSHDFSKIVLEWAATCNGKQLNRIIGVWLGGVELLRSSTPRPLSNGAEWTLQKDITRYYSLLRKKETQELVVYLGNVVDETYTGIYDVTITFHFYPVGEEKPNMNFNYNLDNRADLILPVPQNLQLNHGLWFKVQDSTYLTSKRFKIPQNVYKAVVEVFVSFHEKDELWYSNLPNDYILENELTDHITGNGPFREVLVNLDDMLVGRVWPFTVVYSGCVNPKLWRPITGIGSFDLPSYDIDITPFLGTLLDGEHHEISFGVTNALKVWLIHANLHLWLDPKSLKTEGKLLSHKVEPLTFSYTPDIHGLNGNFKTEANWSISASGWVRSSHGNITSQFSQEMDYVNTMKMEDNAESQTVDQIIHFNQKTYEETPSSNALLTKSSNTYEISFKVDDRDQGLGRSSSQSDLFLVFDEKKYKGDARKPEYSVFHNTQKADGIMVMKDNMVVGGSGSTQQDYRFIDYGGSCYTRSISIKDYMIHHDSKDGRCTHHKP